MREIEAAAGDDERFSYNIIIGGVRFVAAVRGEEKRREGGAEVRDNEASKQRDIKAGGGGEGGEIQCEEKQDEGEAAEARMRKEGEISHRSGDIPSDAVVSGGGGEEG